MVYQPIDLMARETGLEPATSGVTGREKAKEKLRTVRLLGAQKRRNVSRNSNASEAITAVFPQTQVSIRES